MWLLKRNHGGVSAPCYSPVFSSAGAATGSSAAAAGSAPSSATGSAAAAAGSSAGAASSAPSATGSAPGLNDLGTTSRPLLLADLQLEHPPSSASTRAELPIQKQSDLHGTPRETGGPACRNIPTDLLLAGRERHSLTA